jgi:hypothetical protein
MWACSLRRTRCPAFNGSRECVEKGVSPTRRSTSAESRLTGFREAWRAIFARGGSRNRRNFVGPHETAPRCEVGRSDRSSRQAPRRRLLRDPSVQSSPERARAWPTSRTTRRRHPQSEPGEAGAFRDWDRKRPSGGTTIAPCSRRSKQARWGGAIVYAQVKSRVSD